jgi:hypothetical protein
VTYGGVLANGAPEIADIVDITINLQMQRKAETVQ